MRIAIITWFHYRNYGTALQVYALNNYLLNMGHNVEVIRYYPCKRGRVLPDYSFHTTVNNVLGHRIKKLISPINKNNQVNSQVKSGRFFSDENKSQLFDDFIYCNIRFSKICSNLSDLESLNDKYDAFICGSDQIWAPNIFDSHYFLDFVKDTDKLISYAPSIGLNGVNDKYIYRQMSDLIKRFKSLSIREEQGARIIEKMTGRKAEVVTDPTLLISVNHWTDICKSISSDSTQYMIVYMLGNNERHWQETYRFAERKHFKIKVIPVFEEDLERDGCIKNAIGPSEFLSLLKNASYVCTDSFHGTIFSLLFHKQFSVFERFAKEESINQNSRIINLLKATGTLDRLIPYGESYEENREIDYKNVDPLLEKWIDKSKDYLNTSLADVKCETGQEQRKHVLFDHSLCCGCSACSNVCPKSAITIKMNDDGFYHAFVDENKCINCGKCKSVCQFETDIHGRAMIDGRYYSYKDAERSVLQSSSSGGAAYRLASMLMHEGYAVVGCTFDVATQKAKHIFVEKEEDLHKLQGSKYMQSSFSQVLPLIEASIKPVAVFGTPCQIAATRNLFTDRKDIIYVDLICHGVPTYNLYRKYKQYLNEEYGSNFDSLNICFRYKPKGWRAIHIYTTDGKIETCFSQKEDFYFRMFESMNCYSTACYDCKWRDSTMADLRVGDFWGPLFENDFTGVSIIGCMTEMGEKVLTKMKKLNMGSLESQSSDNYLKYQQTKNMTKPLFYDELIKRLNDQKARLPFIVEKYAEPFERSPVSRTTWERRKHIIRLMIDEKR